MVDEYEMYIERVVSQIKNHEWKCPTLIGGYRGDNRNIVKLANAIRNAGFNVDLDESGFWMGYNIHKLTITQKP